MLRFDARGADFDPFAADGRPLDVGIFPRPVDGIIVAAKQAAGAAHLRTLMTDGTLSHGNGGL